MSAIKNRQEWDSILDFWFPEGRSVDIDAQAHHAHWLWRMRGGADAQIIALFSDLTENAARAPLITGRRIRTGGWR